MVRKYFHKAGKDSKYPIMIQVIEMIGYSEYSNLDFKIDHSNTVPKINLKLTKSRQATKIR